MTWQFIDSPPAPGAVNMQADLALAARAAEGTAFFRLYHWQPWCISLGAGQTENEVDFEAAASDGIDVVKRPTGGRAILHAEEVTYAVAMRIPPAFSPLLFYREVNLALQRGLKQYHPVFGSVQLEGVQPDFRAVYASGNSAACFGTSAKSELKFNGKKIAGSAQRKMGSVILQHGSILCGPAHKQIVRYLTGLPADNASVLKLLEEGTTDLAEATGRPVDYPRLRGALHAAFMEYFPSHGFANVTAAPPVTVSVY